MATNNFKSVNPSGIYTLESDDFIEDIHDNILEELKAIGVDAREQDCMSSDNQNGGYGGWLFGMAYGVDNGSYEYVTIELLTRHGYYDGVNLDYIVGYLVNGEEHDDESLAYAHVWDERLKDYKEISLTRVKRLRAQGRALAKKVAKVYANNTTVFNKVGQFSSGEAVYERAK